jgi:hypothetical protein
MPARCPTCGEEALTETAQFCIGCGGPLPESDVDAALAELADSLPDPFGSDRDPEPVSDDAPQLHLPELRAEPEPPPPASAPPPPAPRPAPLPPRDDTPAFDPRPVPSRSATPPPVPTPQQPPRMARYEPMRDTSPIVPLPLVVAGIVGLLALLLILLLAA